MVAELPAVRHRLLGAMVDGRISLSFSGGGSGGAAQRTKDSLEFAFF